MKKNRIIFSSLFMLCLGLLPANAYQKNGNSVTIPVEQQGKFTPKWVRLQVVNDRIIRVEATSETAFPEKESLIIVKQGYLYPQLKAMAKNYVMSLTKGACYQRTETFDFKCIMRPMYPYDDDFE